MNQKKEEEEESNVEKILEQDSKIYNPQRSRYVNMVIDKNFTIDLR